MTHSHFTAILTSLVVTCLALTAVPAHAAGITWATPVNIAADTDVSTNGTLVAAWNVLGASAVTVNGVTFATSGAPTFATTLSGTGVDFSGAAAPFNTLSAGYRTLLSSGAWNGGTSVRTVTLSGLTAGKSYQVQIWSDDSRSTPTVPGYTETVTSTGGNTVTLRVNGLTGALGGLGQYAIGTFVADAATQVITLTSGGTVCNLNAIQLRQLVETTGPTGYWKFDETTGSTAADSSGNGNHGVVHNANSDGGQWNPAGRVGGALRFRGAGLGDDYVTVPNWPGPAGGVVSLSVWVLAETDQGVSLIGRVKGAAQSIASAQEGTPLPPTAWQHVVMVADGGQIKIYRNGVQVGLGSYDGTFVTPAGALILGAQMTNGVNPDSLFQGRIDEVACWGRGLSADEVFKLYAAGAAGVSVLQAEDYANSPPILAVPVQGGNLYANDSLSLQASASGFGPLTYQWWKNGAALPGATSSSYGRQGIAFDAAGQYSVVVTDRNGRSITSTPVNITVRIPALNLAAGPTPDQLLLTWPADATHYRLESSFDLRVWTDVPVGGMNSHTFTTDHPAQFFRLCSP